MASQKCRSRVSKHGSLVVLLKVLALNGVIGQDLTAASLSVQLASFGRFSLPFRRPLFALLKRHRLPVKVTNSRWTRTRQLLHWRKIFVLLFFKKLMIQRAVFGWRQGEVTGQSVSFWTDKKEKSPTLTVHKMALLPTHRRTQHLVCVCVLGCVYTTILDGQKTHRGSFHFLN